MSRSKAKGKSKTKARDKRWTRRFFPLYGLKVASDDGLHDPLWGDATLVAPEKIVPLIERHGQKAHPLLLHRKLADVLGADRIDDIGHAESLVEIPPHAYIAVRDRPSPDDARNRADRIRALLSATMFLRARRNTAFCGSPQAFAWYVTPHDIVVDQSRPPKTSIAPVVNPHIVQRPITVAESALRDSIRRGDIATNSAGWEWDLSSEHSVSSLLNEGGRSPFRKRLIAVALQIQRASCSLPHSSQIQMAVTALEVLFNTQTFSDLRARVGAYFHGKDAQSRIDDFIRERHEATHSGIVRDENELATTAGHALAMAWISFDVATGFSEHFDGNQFEMYTRALVDVSLAEEKIGRILNTDGGSTLLAAFHARFAHVRPRLTLRGSPVTGSSGDG